MDDSDYSIYQKIYQSIIIQMILQLKTDKINNFRYQKYGEDSSINQKAQDVNLKSQRGLHIKAKPGHSRIRVRPPSKFNGNF